VANVYSEDIGALVFAAVYPDLTALEASFDKLNVDNEFHSLSDKAHDYILPGTLQDGVWSILYPEGDQASTREVNYTLVVQAFARPGKLMAAAASGPELCQVMQEASGVPAEFAVEDAGAYGRMMLLQQFADAAEYERAQTALIASQQFLEVIDSKVPELFEITTATRRLYRRIV
jgi:hypothetical protein